MNWSNERYVRLYTRDTTGWLLMSWQAQALFCLLLRKADRSGVIALGSHGMRGICAHVKMPWDLAEPALEELVADGCVTLRVDDSSTELTFPNYIAANEAISSNAQRQREWRKRSRNARVTPVDNSDAPVDNLLVENTNRNETSTQRDETLRDVDGRNERDATSCNTVTPIRSVPIRTDPIHLKDPDPDARAREVQLAGQVALASGSTAPVPQAEEPPPPTDADAPPPPQPKSSRPAYQRNGGGQQQPQQRYGGYVEGSVPTTAHRCLVCGTQKPPFFDDAGRRKCKDCYWGRTPPPAPTEET